MKLNEKIIKLRKDNNLSQEEFGNKLNVSRQSISKWENGESNPEINKIREISKIFNVSYEYLLNDEVDKQEIKNEENIIIQKRKINIVLKIFFILILIYILFCMYKFIVFYRFYLIANSFSEENYFMSLRSTSKSITNGDLDCIFETKKVRNKKELIYYCLDDSRMNTDTFGYDKPLSISYTDAEKRISYTLGYNFDKQKYVYSNNLDNAINDEEREEWFNISANTIKENTLYTIPSGFSQILKASINPLYYYVSISNKEYRVKNFDKTEIKVKLTNDYLLERVEYNYNNMDFMVNSYSYDYVQDHFTELDEPIIEYDGQIIYEN